MKRIFLSLMVALYSFCARAQADMLPLMPEDFSQVDVYLLTVGRGTQMHALFGHTILRVVDRVKRQDYNFNWGIFNFNSPLFAWTFYRGDLDYQLATMSFYDMVTEYRDYEQRAVIQDKLNLTAIQKRALMQRLIENTKPENIFYKYFQFRDNCATRVRDHLDAILDGRIRDYFRNRQSPVVFRDHIRRNAAPNWLIGLGLDYLSNSMLDQPIGPWEEMFLPSALRLYLAEMPAYDDQGQAVAGVNLLSDRRVIVDKPEPPLGNEVHAWIAVVLGVPVLIGCLAILFNSSESASSHLEQRRLGYRLFGAAILIFSLWTALWGTTMLLNWLISYYDELQHNALLLIMSPLDWILVCYGLVMLKNGCAPTGSLRVWSRNLALLHIFGWVLLAVAAIFTITTQNVSAPLASTGVVGLMAYASIYWRTALPQQGGKT